MYQTNTKTYTVPPENSVKNLKKARIMVSCSFGYRIRNWFSYTIVVLQKIIVDTVEKS